VTRTLDARKTLLTTAATAALFALVAVLILYSSRPAAADEPALPGEAPDRDSAPASGLIWAGLGGTFTPPEPETVESAATRPAAAEPVAKKPAATQPVQRQQISTPERAKSPEKSKSVGDPKKNPLMAPFANKPPQDKTLSITIPRMGLKDLEMPDSSSQSVLDRQGIMHLSGTGFPWQRLSNTYVAGHAQGYAGSRYERVFEDLDKLRDGDRIILRDANGKAYTYKVYKSFVVSPADYWVTNPVKDRQVVTLQTCWPAPSYEQRLIVRAERVEEA
jgi:sortase A